MVCLGGSYSSLWYPTADCGAMTRFGRGREEMQDTVEERASEEDQLGRDDVTAFEATTGKEWSSVLYESVILPTLECWLLYWRVGVLPSISPRVQGME